MPGPGEAASARILVVEDEPKVARALREGLQAEGFSVLLAATGEEGFYLASTERFDLLVVDRMLPGRDGLEILTTLRCRGLETPVLLLTAGDDRAECSTLADDFLVKPFAFPELLARVRSLLHRNQDQGELRLAVADLVICSPCRAATRGGRKLELTEREFELLEYLARHRGVTVSREMVARDVFKEAARDTALDSVIDAYIARLRLKVDQGAARPLIHTVRGVGFQLN